MDTITMNRISATISPKQNTERLYFIELYKIIAMFMVIILHVLGQGGVIDGTQSGSVNYWVAWVMEIGMVLLTGIGIFVSCIVIDWLRIRSFKLLRVERCIDLCTNILPKNKKKSEV